MLGAARLLKDLVHWLLGDGFLRHLLSRAPWLLQYVVDRLLGLCCQWRWLPGRG